MKLKRARYFIVVLLFWYMRQSYAYTTDEPGTLELVYGDEQMVSIATGREQLLYKAPSVATVITRRQIEMSNAQFLNELLEMVPGMHVSEDYYAANAIYSMRGFFRDPDAGVLVLIDGVPINTLQTGSRFSSFRLPVNNIEQIEIIRGPGSAVYGADAFVGTINVITRKDASRKEYGLYGGAFNTSSMWLSENYQSKAWRGSISIQTFSTQGDENRIVDADLQTFLDNQTGTQVSLAPGQMNTESEILNFQMNLSISNWNYQQWFWSNTNQGNGHGVPGLDVLDPVGGVDSQSSMTILDYKNDSLVNNWQFNVRFSFLDYTADSFQMLLPPGSIPPIGTDGNLFTTGIWLTNVTFTNGMIDAKSTEEQHGQLEVTGFYDGWQRHQLRLSAGYQQQKFYAEETRNYGPGVPLLDQLTTVTDTPYIFLPDGVRYIRYASVQDEWDFFTDWTLTAGVRYDNYSDFGETSNPRLALVWQTDYDLTTKLLYGRAFRSPVYEELKLQNQMGFTGNAQLQPETIDTLELAFDYRPDSNLRGLLSLYGYKAKNLIFSVEDLNIANTYSFENTGEQQGYGVEAEMNWLLSRWLSLSANYAWQYNEINHELEAPGAPSNKAYLRLDWKLATFWSLNTEIYFIGQRPRALNDLREPVDPVTRLDTRLRYRNHYQKWDFSISIRNLLDSDIREPSLGNDSIQPGGAALADDVPMEGLKWLCEFRYFP